MVDILSLMSSINEDIKKLFEQAYQQAYMQGRRDQSLISVYKYEEDAIHNQWTMFEPELMYKLFTKVCISLEELIEVLKLHN